MGVFLLFSRHFSFRPFSIFILFCSPICFKPVMSLMKITPDVGCRTDLFRPVCHESLHLSVLKEDSVYFLSVMHVPYNGLMKDMTDFWLGLRHDHIKSLLRQRGDFSCLSTIWRYVTCFIEGNQTYLAW